MAGVDPHDVRLGAGLRAGLAVEIHLLLERRVGEQRRHGDAPAALGGERVRAVGCASEIDAVLAVDERHDVRVRDVVVRPLEREPLVLERGEQQVDGLLVARARVLVERLAGGQRQPAVAAADAPFVAAAGEDVRGVDDAGQNGRIVVREHVQHRAKVDVVRALRGCCEERRRVRRDRELRKEEMLDRGVAVVAEPVGVDDLLEHLCVELLRRLAGMELELRVQAEAHG